MLAHPPRSGFSSWLTACYLEQGEWKSAQFGFGKGRLQVDDLPDRCFSSQGEQDEVARLLESPPRGGGLESDHSWSRLARDRIYGDRLEYFLVLPLRRSVGLWMSYHRSAWGDFSLFSSSTRGVLIYSIWCLPFILLSLLGGAPSWPDLFRAIDGLDLVMTVPGYRGWAPQQNVNNDLLVAHLKESPSFSEGEDLVLGQRNPVVVKVFRDSEIRWP